MTGTATLLAAHPLVHLNAILNLLATILLVFGGWQIRRGRERSHGRTMAAALVVSAAFLVSYVTYHLIAGQVNFTHPGAVRYVYLTILATHVILAATVPFLAVAAAWLGARALGWIGDGNDVDAQMLSRARHRRLVRWAYPIWLYVSVTGVVVYLMLYHLWPPVGS